MQYVRTLLLILVAIIGRQAFAQAAGAADLKAQGLIEFGMSGELDLDAKDKSRGNIDLQLGYFVKPSFEWGLVSNFGTRPYTAVRDSMGIFLEYDFNERLGMMPILGFQARYAKTTEELGAQNARLLAAYAGFKIAMKEGIGFTWELMYENSSKSVFGLEGERSKSNMRTLLGYRIFY